MRTYLALLLCLSVLLSGCIAVNTAIFKPEPDSGGDWAVRVLGGWGDFAIGCGLGMGITDEVMNLTDYTLTLYEYLALVNLLIVAGAVGTTLTDVVIRNALPYRKAYYEAKKSEEEATDYPEEEPSEESPDVVE